MLRIVLDTNVWISATLWRGKPNKIVEMAERGKVGIFASADILRELGDVLYSKKDLHKHIGNIDIAIQDLIASIASLAIIVDAKEKLGIIKEDEADNRILECAAACNADYIVSGDRHLLELKKFRTTKILSASEFVAIAQQKGWA